MGIKRTISEEKLQEMASRYAAGTSLALLAKESEMAKNTMRRLLAGVVAIRGKGRPKKVVA